MNDRATYLADRYAGARISIGTIGLIKVIESFQTGNGSKRAVRADATGDREGARHLTELRKPYSSGRTTRPRQAPGSRTRSTMRPAS
nr:hypothetical protein [Paenibacillus andongensis]